MLQLIGEPISQSLVKPNHVVVGAEIATVISLDKTVVGEAQVALDVNWQVIKSPSTKFEAAMVEPTAERRLLPFFFH